MPPVPSPSAADLYPDTPPRPPPHPPPQYAWWPTQTMAWVQGDMAYWAATSDAVHRTACYGPDPSEWPR